jgi:hypothetical protein
MGGKWAVASMLYLKDCIMPDHPNQTPKPDPSLEKVVQIWRQLAQEYDGRAESCIGPACEFWKARADEIRAILKDLGHPL